jgi:copper transport protein
MKLKPFSALPFFLFILALFVASPALAHGYILRAIPTDRAVLERPPVRLQYWFSEGLEPRFSSLNVRDQTGQIISTGGVSDTDNTLLTVRLPANLPDGAYIVELRPAFASDGHVSVESRVFFVGQEVSGIAGAAPSDEAYPLEVVWRVMVLSSTTLLFGTFALYSIVLVPAWGNPQHRAGLLPPRLMHRLNQMVIVALVLAFAGNILALLQQAMAFFGLDAVQIIQQNLWDVVRIGSRFGDVWNLRMMLLALIAVSHGLSIYLRSDQPETVRAFWNANVWLMALVIGTSSIASHAAGSLLWPWIALTINWIHALGVAFWVGGIAVLVLVLPIALQPYEGAARRLALLTVMRRFSRLVVGVLFIVITTGLYSALNWLYLPSDLTQTTYGQTLLLKVLLVTLLVYVGSLHYVALRPQAGVWIEGIWSRFRLLHGLGVHGYYRAGQFAGTIRLEVMFALIVLTTTALLSATPVPQPDSLKNPVETPTLSQTVNGLSISMTLSPGGPGVNTYDTLVLQDDQPQENLNLRLQMVNPNRDWRGEVHSVEPVGDGLYVTAGDEIDRSGRWWTILDITDSGGSTTRAVFDWNIAQDAALVTSRSPNLLHFVALLSILLAVTWTFYPALSTFARRLDLSPATVLIGVSVIIVTVIASLLAFTALQESRRQYEQTLYPPPKVVNTVLPDADSLRRGQILYKEHCAAWPTIEDDFAAFKSSIHVLRDDGLFITTANGWRNLPACTGELTAEQRWDIVNYLRTLSG